MKENVLIYKSTEKMYCDTANFEKTLKKATPKRKQKWGIVTPGKNPGLGVSCLDCNIEIGSDFCWISHKVNVCHRRYGNFGHGNFI